ncbi:hypothetical protein [Clostridium sp.]|uniref:IS66 family insertion sequence element accessory protein TnpA n=1 Tax=Clostridium sp. TaxID=1506 RepID=UPI0026310F23|nr:hypothetical protein [Clostridium sp.]
MRAKSKEIWQTRINDYRKSKKSARKWCEENNLSVSALKYWITKFNKEESKSFSKPEFVPIATVENIDDESSASATIKFGRISIDVLDGCKPDTIKTIIDVLNSYV